MELDYDRDNLITIHDVTNIMGIYWWYDGGIMGMCNQHLDAWVCGTSFILQPVLYTDCQARNFPWLTYE